MSPAGWYADLRLILRLARRELRGGTRGFGVFLACLALGVAAIGAVGALGEFVEQGVRADAKALLGGDLELRQTHQPLPHDVRAWLDARATVTETVRLRAMVSATTPSDTGLPLSSVAEVKAVDGAYPLYGEALTRSGRSVGEALGLTGPETEASADASPAPSAPPAIVEEALLTKLDASVGDTVRLGATDFRIADVLEYEPDRAASFIGLGPRFFMASHDLEGTGLVRFGSVIHYYYGLKLERPGGGTVREADAEALLKELDAAYPDGSWRVRRVAQAGGSVKRFMDEFSKYLVLVGLASLLVGGIGVASGVRTYLAGKHGAIAAMKCLGASRRVVTGVYLVQTLTLALLGSLLGLVLGWIAASAAGLALSAKLGIAVRIGLYPAPLLRALGFGLLVATAFSLWPLSAAAAVRPARLFRGYADPGRLLPSWRALLGIATTVAFLTLLTVTATHAPGIALGFLGGTALCMVLFFALGKVLRVVASKLPHPHRPALRHALANLHRPGSPAGTVLFSLGLGLTVLVAVLGVDRNIARRINEQIPTIAPAFFFINIPSSRIEEFRQRLHAMEGVSKVEDEPSLRGRITHINGVPVDQVAIDPSVSWAIRSDRGLTFKAEPPRGSEIVSGAWWPPDYQGPPTICLTSDLAEGFGIGVGDTITVNVLGRELTPTLSCTRKVDWASMSLNHAIVFAPGVLEGAPFAYIATAYTDPAYPEVDARIQAELTHDMPEAVSLYMKDVLADVRRVMNHMGWALLATLSVTVLAGLLVLAEALRANLDARRYDAVVLKVLGATGRDVLLSLMAEFCLLGLITAAIAVILGSVGSWAFTHFVFKSDWAFPALPVFGLTVGAILATLGLGLAGVRKALRQKAWHVLRNE